MCCHLTEHVYASSVLYERNALCGPSGCRLKIPSGSHLNKTTRESVLQGHLTSVSIVYESRHLARHEFICYLRSGESVS